MECQGQDCSPGWGAFPFVFWKAATEAAFLVDEPHVPEDSDERKN
jgi:hypothetical protein